MHHESELYGKLVRLGHLLHRQHHQRRRQHGPGGDPHRGQGRVMSLLKMKPEMSQRDLAYLLDIRPQSLGEVLAKLERGGYIERTPSEADRRSMQIRLTEAGAAAAEQSDGTENIFASLSPEEMTVMESCLGRIIAGLEKSLEDEDGGRGCRHCHDDGGGDGESGGEPCGHGRGRHARGRHGHGPHPHGRESRHAGPERHDGGCGCPEDGRSRRGGHGGGHGAEE